MNPYTRIETVVLIGMWAGLICFFGYQEFDRAAWCFGLTTLLAATQSPRYERGLADVGPREDGLR